MGHVGRATMSEWGGIQTQDIEAVTVADMGWGTPLFDLQSNLGLGTAGVLEEIYEGRTLYSMGSGSRKKKNPPTAKKTKIYKNFILAK